MIPVGKKLIKVTVAEFDAGNNVCYIGGFGIGKTSMAREIVKWYEKERNIKMELVNWKGSKYTPEQVSGLMFINKEHKTTEFYPHAWLKSDRPIFLMLDEITNVPARTVAAFAEVLTERRFGEVELHPDSKILAAGNPPTESRVASELMEILRTRMTVLQVNASKDDFMTYGIDHDIDPTVLSFIQYNPDELYQFRADERNMPCPRNWENLSNSLKSFRKHGIDLVKAITDPKSEWFNVAMELIKGRIGETATNKFAAHAKITQEIDIEAIIELKKKELTKLEQAKDSLQFFVMLSIISLFASDVIDEKRFCDIFIRLSNPIKNAGILHLKESDILVNKGIMKKISDGRGGYFYQIENGTHFMEMLQNSPELIDILTSYSLD